MYYKKFFYNSVFSTTFTRSNPKIIPVNVKHTSSEQWVFNYIFAMQNTFTPKMNKLTAAFRCFYNNGNICEAVAKHVSKTPSKSSVLLRTWAQQCEYIMAQRFRRTQQMFCLYTRLWEEHALKELLNRMKQQMLRRSKELILGAVGISQFDWKSQKISDSELAKHNNEFNYVRLLTEKTILCPECNQQSVVDIMLPDKNYCKCPNSNVRSHDEWLPFLERSNLLVWRRQRNGSGGTYEYKLYGKYDDVTAEDFLEVQINTSFRQTWDTTAVNLYVVDSDEQSHSDIIYWEMQWPRMFSNRDYVYNRRYVIDETNKLITIVSRSVEHPDCPAKNDKHRVHDYESCFVIRPSTDFNSPGIEFSLTYYDDPGVNIPAAVTSWVAIAGMPDFLYKLRLAAKKYHDEKGVSIQQPHLDKDKEPIITPAAPTSSTDQPPNLTSNITIEPEKTKSKWSYFHPYYYLG